MYTSCWLLLLLYYQAMPSRQGRIRIMNIRPQLSTLTTPLVQAFSFLLLFNPMLCQTYAEITTVYIAWIQHFALSTLRKLNTPHLQHSVLGHSAIRKFIQTVSNGMYEWYLSHFVHISEIFVCHSCCVFITLLLFWS